MPTEDRFEYGFDRRVLAVDPQKTPLYRFDVLVLGAGAAGGAAALAAANGGAQVAVVTKAEFEETNTLYAQGGMAAVLADSDSPAAHTADTLAVGCGLAEPEVVERVVSQGAEAVDLLMSWGAEFDRRADGGLELSREGGHSRRRIVHARGDATGREVQATLCRTLEEHPRIAIFPHTFVVDLRRSASGRVVGALARDGQGAVVAFSAAHTILATGGAGQVYRETTNPVIATGDGVALGFRAGAALRDLEFFQFHPTCLYIAGAARVLISEIVRGAGGVLRDKNGHRFMPDFHPDAELAPRDVVSRAVFDRMVETSDTSVNLDLSAVDGDPHALFPGISRICRFFGIDIGKDPVPVRPGAHYMIGGLLVDEAGRTTVPGLWAVGECASTGMHGANRMGSNSLLEAIVLGTSVGRATAAAPSDGMEPDGAIPPLTGIEDDEPPPQGMRMNLADVTYSLKSLMTRSLGVKRQRGEMEDVLKKISLWNRAVRALAPAEPRTWELLNMITFARLATLAAIGREESRGVHFRTDYPELSSAGTYHSIIRPMVERGSLCTEELTRLPVAMETMAVERAPSRA